METNSNAEKFTGWSPDEPEPLEEFELEFETEAQFHAFKEELETTLNEIPFSAEERDYYRTHIIEFTHLLARKVIPDFTLTKKQEQYLLAIQDMRYTDIGLLTPRGGGKTFLDAVVAVWSVLCYNRYAVVILGGSKDQSYNVWEYIETFFIENPRLALLVDGKIGRGRLRLVNKSWILAIAASPTAARGKHPSCLMLDEVVEIKPTIIRAARGQLTTSSFGVMQHGRLIMTSTAQTGPSVRFFQKTFEGGWEVAKEGGLVPDDYFGAAWRRKNRYNGFVSFHWTLVDCAWMNMDRLETMKATVSEEEWRVEYLGLFGVLTGLVFNPDHVDYIINNAKKPNYQYASPIYPSFGGVDWGYSKFPTAIVCVQLQKDGIIRVIDVEGDVGIDYSIWHITIRDKWKQLKLVEVNADGSNVSDNQSVRDLGVPMNSVPFQSRVQLKNKKTGKTSKKTQKTVMMETLRFLIENHYIEIHKKFEKLVDQVYAYHWVESGNEEAEDAKLTKENCDYVEALMLAVLPILTHVLRQTDVEMSGVTDGKTVDKDEQITQPKFRRQIFGPAHNRKEGVSAKPKTVTVNDKEIEEDEEKTILNDPRVKKGDVDDWMLAVAQSR